ncbi:pyrophosphate--fructose 6-phosphate 1-phosphotransferase subunit beta 1-like [Silene latifolia]|uniref:pyrophosphate--fructose 6-phosphate 1-phosphotransferase subunit beta 1-like n=1 Tax=Silene latifolia TaxID=37657 RepID=UPI003D76E35D
MINTGEDDNENEKDNNARKIDGVRMKSVIAEEREKREKVYAKKQTLKNVTDYITDIVCKRSKLGFNYGVVLVPEGLIDFIPEVQQLIAELNEILASGVVDEGGEWKKKLKEQSRQLFEILPQAIRDQLLLERDPHGNVSKIETEKMLIQMLRGENQDFWQCAVFDSDDPATSRLIGS